MGEQYSADKIVRVLRGYLSTRLASAVLRDLRASSGAENDTEEHEATEPAPAPDSAERLKAREQMRRAGLLK